MTAQLPDGAADLADAAVELADAVERSYEHLAASVARDSSTTHQMMTDLTRTTHAMHATVNRLRITLAVQHARSSRAFFTVGAVLALLIGSSSMFLLRLLRGCGTPLAPPLAERRDLPTPKPKPKPRPRPAPRPSDAGLTEDTDRDAVVPDEVPPPLHRWINCDGSLSETNRLCPSLNDQEPVNP